MRYLSAYCPPGTAQPGPPEGEDDGRKKMLFCYLAREQISSYLPKHVVSQVQFSKARNTLKSTVLEATKHIVFKVEVGKGNIVLEVLLRHAGEEVMAQVKLVELFQGFESIISHFVKDVML